VAEIARDVDPYSRLASSIGKLHLYPSPSYLYAHAYYGASAAPEIYGHDDVKKALLLQLVGGSTRYVVRTATEHVPGVAPFTVLVDVLSNSPM
jgi:hypothetical protein